MSRERSKSLFNSQLQIQNPKINKRLHPWVINPYQSCFILLTSDWYKQDTANESEFDNDWREKAPECQRNFRRNPLAFRLVSPAGCPEFRRGIPPEFSLDPAGKFVPIFRWHFSDISVDFQWILCWKSAGILVVSSLVSPAEFQWYSGGAPVEFRGNTSGIPPEWHRNSTWIPPGNLSKFSRGIVFMKFCQMSTGNWLEFHWYFGQIPP